MGDIQDLQAIFEQFCAYGASRSSINDLSSAGEGSPQCTMDSAKFAKFARDSGLLALDRTRLTATDIDIIFNKAKPKAGASSRKLDWQAFVHALHLVADKLYPEKLTEERFIMLMRVVINAGGPATRATVAKADGVYNKLTNTTMYTGIHKNSPGVSNTGGGSVTRSITNLSSTPSGSTSRLASSMSTSNPNLSAGSAAPVKRAEKPPSGQKRDRAAVVTASSEKLDLVAHAQKKAEAKQAAVDKNKPYTTTAPGSSVFDRLTNSQAYTGTHKQRFNADGTGRGLAGRDSPTKSGNAGTYRGGDVKDLSQILRN